MEVSWWSEGSRSWTEGPFGNERGLLDRVRVYGGINESSEPEQSTNRIPSMIATMRNGAATLRDDKHSDIRVLLQSLALIAYHRCDDRVASSQAATWNSSAMKASLAVMSVPLIFRTCLFLFIAIASEAASVRRAVGKLPMPSPGPVKRSIHWWSCSENLFKYFTRRTRERNYNSPSAFISATDFA
jgi:hypothetical protein